MPKMLTHAQAMERNSRAHAQAMERRMIVADADSQIAQGFPVAIGL
jgi:hypothetical protein